MSQDWSTSVPTFTNDAESDIGTMRLMFATLRSGFLGATSPASPVAGQGWIDTTAHRFKIRNEANTAWISVYDLANSKPLGTIDNATLAATATNALNLGGVAASAFAQTGSQTFTSGGDFTVPAGVNRIFITATSGGGGGADTGDGVTQAAGGAGGRFVIGYPVAVTPAAVHAVAIGAGGSGGINGGAAATAGGTTSVGSLLSLAGGAAGGSTTGGSNPGGFPCGQAAGGDQYSAGGDVFPYTGGTTSASGGGGGAGLFGNGGNAGGSGSAAAANTGGGGGGGFTTGGAGGSGKVIIYW